MPQTIAYCKEGSKQKVIHLYLAMLIFVYVIGASLLLSVVVQELQKVLDNWVARGLFKEEDLRPEGSGKDEGKQNPQTSSVTVGPPAKTKQVASIMTLLQQKADAVAGPSGDSTSVAPTPASSVRDDGPKSAANDVLGSNAPASSLNAYSGSGPYSVAMRQDTAGRDSTAHSVALQPPIGNGNRTAMNASHYGPATDRVEGGDLQSRYGGGIGGPRQLNAGWMPPNSSG